LAFFRDAERKEGASVSKKGEKEKDEKDKDAKKEEVTTAKDKEEKKK
jgi:hypothetical protein